MGRFLNYRVIRTTQERRANQEGWCRGRRKPHRLPNAWNDYPMYAQRCWKKYRRTQYRAKDM